MELVLESRISQKVILNIITFIYSFSLDHASKIQRPTLELSERWCSCIASLEKNMVFNPLKMDVRADEIHYHSFIQKLLVRAPPLNRTVGVLFYVSKAINLAVRCKEYQVGQRITEEWLCRHRVQTDSTGHHWPTISQQYLMHNAFFPRADWDSNSIDWLIKLGFNVTFSNKIEIHHSHEVTQHVLRYTWSNTIVGIGIGIYLGCFLPGGNSAHNTTPLSWTNQGTHIKW